MDDDDVVKDDVEDTLHDTLTAAFEQSEQTEGDKGVSKTEGVDQNVNKEVKEGKEDKVSKAPENLEKVEDKKVVGEAKRSKEVGTTVVEPAVKPTRAPGSWKPAAREKWAALPPEIQQEVLRREREIAVGFNETTDVRKFRDEFNRTMTPYQHIIAAEGGNPLKVANDLFATAAVLYNGSAAQKVQTAAALIRNFGIDLQMLDSALAGQPAKAGTNGGNQDAASYIRNEIQAALAPLLRGQQEQGQKFQTEVGTEITAFADDPKNEFFEDVRDTMADLLEVAAKQGKTMDLSTAYNRAIMMHSEISDVVSERKLQEKVVAKNSVAAAARKKASGVTGAPSKGGSAEGVGKESMRSDILSAIDSLS